VTDFDFEIGSNRRDFEELFLSKGFLSEGLSSETTGGSGDEVVVS
jgi:hypothetical protein